MVSLPEVYSINTKSVFIDNDHILLPYPVYVKVPKEVKARFNGSTKLTAVGKEVECRREEEILSGKNLGKFTREMGAIVQIEIEPGFLNVRPLLSLGERANPGDSAGDAIIFEPDEIFDMLTRGNFVSKEILYISNEAQWHSLKPGFDELLSLGASRDVIPYTYQTNTVKRVLRKLRGRAILCDEVGLGKTVEAGLAMMEYVLRGLVKSVLILTPPSLLTQWQEEMSRKFNLYFVTSDSPEFKRAGAGAWTEFGKIIASLSTAKHRKNIEHIRNARFDMVIVDEAHYLRNRNTLAWRFVSELNKKYILLLTATPVQNSLEELYNLITILKPGQLKTTREFHQRFITRGDRLKPKNTDALKSLIGEVMIRNRRSTSGIKFTKRYARTVKIDLTPPEREIYSKLTDFVRKEYVRFAGETNSSQDTQEEETAPLNRFTLKTLQMELGSSSAAIIPTLEKTTLRSDLSYGQKSQIEDILKISKSIKDNAKMNALQSTVSRIDDKLVIFTRYLATLRYIEENLKKAGFSAVVYHGGLRSYEKEEVIERFRKDAQVLISTEAGGEGRNLQFCNMLVNYDLPWNPMRIEQRIGRLSRIGQERDVFIFNLSARETIEELILDVLDSKINMFELVVGEVDMILGKLEEERPFEDVVMEILAASPTQEDFKRRMDELGETLLSMKRDYEAVQEVEDKIFGSVGDEG